MKYQPRPRLVEAAQFNGSASHLVMMRAWIRDGSPCPDQDYLRGKLMTQDCGRELELVVATGEKQTARRGDFVIKCDERFFVLDPTTFNRLHVAA